MGKNHTSSLRNTFFFLKLQFQLPLSSLHPLICSISSSLRSLYCSSYIPHFFSLLSPPVSLCIALLWYISPFLLFHAFSYHRCLGCKLVAYIPKFFVLLIIIHDQIVLRYVLIFQWVGRSQGRVTPCGPFLSRWVSFSYRGCYIVNLGRDVPIFGLTPFSIYIFCPQTQTDKVRLTGWPISTINISRKNFNNKKNKKKPV